MDGPSIFASILDRGAGLFRLGPTDLSVPAEQRYLPGTMILETTWDTPTGWAVVRDVLLIGPWRHDSPRSAAYRRVPTDQAAEHVLLRTVRCLSGSVDFELECEPAFDYGRRRGTWHHTGDGYSEAEVAAGDDDPSLRLTTDLNLGFEGQRAIARFRLRAEDNVYAPPGRRRASALVRGGPPATGCDGGLLARMDQSGKFPDHPWRPHLQRSALTLRG